MTEKKYVNILTPFPYESFMRQLPKSMENELFCFYENSLLDRVWDMVVVYEGLNEKHTIKCKKGGLVFISGEPPFSRRYSTYFLNQFDHLITSHSGIKHKNNHLTQQALPWHFGLSYETKQFNYIFEDLVNLSLPRKTKKVSIISSNKTMMPGHKQRMIFLEAIKDKFGDQIDFFGQGINPVDDKADALLPYMFNICIENSSIEGYWTEKIADPLLSYSIPIYHGCKNIGNYFDEDFLIKIDINNLKGSIEVIEKILNNADKIYSEKIDQLIIERKKLLFEYNLFAVLVRFYQENINNYLSIEDTITIFPSESFRDHKMKMNLLRLKRFVLRYLN